MMGLFYETFDTSDVIPSWSDHYITNSDNLEALISYAEIIFDDNPAPYRVYITDRHGKILFYREKV